EERTVEEELLAAGDRAPVGAGVVAAKDGRGRVQRSGEGREGEEAGGVARSEGESDDRLALQARVREGPGVAAVVTDVDRPVRRGENRLRVPGVHRDR